MKRLLRFILEAGARFLLMSLLLCIAPRILAGQDRGAVVLGEAVAGLDVTPRVLMIAAHPDDEDTQLITFLARGRHVETGYLSLTRGDGGQNLIGNELGEQLGMIRTEELLAARRIDGGRQFFSRAFDFGFSKTAEETYRHWPKDSILRDVVTVIRAFRPQVLVEVFSGTPRDGHGHHQVSALLAREAFDAAADTIRFPRSMTLGLGPWSASKFYRATRFTPNEASVSFNVGEMSALRGRTYAELASLSRSQHLSQGFGQLERRGSALDNLKLEVSRVSDVTKKEISPLDDIAADWSRFRMANLPSAVRAAIDSIPEAIRATRAVENLAAPVRMVVPLAQLVGLIARTSEALGCDRVPDDAAAACDGERGDLAVTLATAARRATTALLSAAGVVVEATAPREYLAEHDTLPVTISVYNQGTSSVQLESATAYNVGAVNQIAARSNTTILPDSSAQLTVRFLGGAVSSPWWLQRGRQGDVFRVPDRISASSRNIATGEDRLSDTHTAVTLNIAGTSFRVDAGPVVYRFADPARGELRRPLAIVPAISVLFDNDVEYARANTPLDRTYNVRLHSSSNASRSATVTLSAPGLSVDSATRHVGLEPFSDAIVSFRVKGSYAAGEHTISATVASGSDTFTSGFVPIQYEHIRPLRYFRAASVRIEAVEATLPKNANVAYIRGVGDNVAPMLSELGLRVTMLTPEALATADLSRYGSVIVGPRAFAASKDLAARAPRLEQFARAGGTVVMQYGQQEIQAAGILPYPVTLQRTAERVTVEETPVTMLAPKAPVLNSPNRITQDDFANWVQERSTYMPSSADPHWQRIFEMHDPGEKPNENSLLVAPVGKGAYVYVTLALFRQLPAGVPGPARLFLNLVGAQGQQTTNATLTP